MTNDDELSFLEVELFLSELTEENPLVANLLRRFFYDNPTKRMAHSAKLVISNKIIEQKDKTKKCQHEGCELDSINSHVISENKLRRFLSANHNGKFLVDVLDIDLKNNPYAYIFKEKSTTSVSSFMGYCRDHDRDLFVDLDCTDVIESDKLLNLQYLRMLREEINNLEVKVNLFSPLIIELNELSEKDEETQYEEYVNNLKTKLDFENIKLQRARNLYKKILIGINSENYIILTKKYKVKKSDWMFAKYCDLTKYEDNESYSIFLLKEEYEDDAYIYIGAVDNNNSIEIFETTDPLKVNGQNNLINLMLGAKDYFSFTLDFKENLNPNIKSFLLELDLSNRNSFIEEILFAEILF